MKDFIPVRFHFLIRVLNTIEKVKYLQMIYFINEDAIFVDSIEKYLKKRISLFSSAIASNFPQMFSYRIYIKIGDRSVNAGGKGLSKEDSRARLFGEFLERISSIVPLDIYIKNQYNIELTRKEIEKKSVLAKSALSVFSIKKFGASEMYYGVPQANFRFRKYHKTSNGYAGHFSTEKAIVSGWLELIERDSFFVYWLNSFQPKKISIDDDYFLLDNDLCKIRQDIIKFSINITILDLTSDIGVPVVGCLIHSHREDDTYFGFGASAGFTFKEIFLKAYYEALGGARYSYKRLADLSLTNDYVPFLDKNINLEKRQTIYLDGDNFKKIKFFFESKNITQVKLFIGQNNKIISNRDQINRLKDIFRKKSMNNADFEVYYYEINNNLIKLFQYKVVRVICNGLYPIYLNENFADTNHPRLKEFRDSILTDKSSEVNYKINIWPHIFP